MKLCRGWLVSAGLVLAANSANAQIAVPDHRPVYSVVSDVDGPYAAMPPQARGYQEGGYYGGPHLLPAPEVYTVLRDNGFSPLGAPQQRGMFYTIAVVDRSGGEGRLVIDARNGQIVRYARGYPADPAVVYGPPGAPPPVSAVRGPPRPPGLVPHVASRAVPMPKAMPERSEAPQTVGKASEPAKDSAKIVEPAKPAEPAPQSVAQAKPAAVPAAPPAVVEAKPAPQILPTKEMPKVQGLE